MLSVPFQAFLLDKGHKIKNRIFAGSQIIDNFVNIHLYIIYQILENVNKYTFLTYFMCMIFNSHHSCKTLLWKVSKIH